MLRRFRYRCVPMIFQLCQLTLRGQSRTRSQRVQYEYEIADKVIRTIAVLLLS